MILDYIALGVLAVSVGGILIVLARKFPVLAAIDTRHLPRHQHHELKADLIESRLYRKVKFLLRHVRGIVSILQIQLLNLRERLRIWIRALEHKYQVPTDQLSSGGRVARDKQITRLLEEGAEFVKSEEYQEAEKKFIEVISLDPRSVGAYKGLGEVYFIMKDFDHAKEVFSHALKLNQKDDSTHARLGNIAAQMGHFEEAQAEYLESVALNSQIADHHIDLGETYKELDKQQEALKSFKEAVRLEPNNPRNLDALIEQTIRLKDKKLAIETLRQLRDVNPENQKLKDFQEQIDNLG